MYNLPCWYSRLHKTCHPTVFSFPLFSISLCTRTVQSWFVPHVTFLVQNFWEKWKNIRAEPRLGTPEAGYLGSVRLVVNRRIGSATERKSLRRSRVEHQICGVSFFSNTQDTVVNVTKNRNEVFLMVLVCRGSKGWCNFRDLAFVLASQQ